MTKVNTTKYRMTGVLLIAVLMALHACTEADETVGALTVDDVAVGFSPSIRQSTVTRAGQSGVLSLDMLKTEGFGVFAYHTADAADFTNYRFTEYDGVGTHPALSARTPNFMYNTHVSYATDHWAYEPLKYWPNGLTTGNADASEVTGSGGMVSYFFYAPFVNRPSYADLSAAVASSENGIIFFDEKSVMTEPGVYYRPSSQPSDGVDLTWGVASRRIDYKIWPVNTLMSGLATPTNIIEGMPLLDLQRPYEKSVVLPVVFRHATTRLDLLVQGAFDELDPDAIDRDDETRILVNEVSIKSYTPSHAKLCLQNTTADEPRWENVSGHAAYTTSLTKTTSDMNTTVKNVDNPATYLATASNFDLLPEGVVRTAKNLHASDQAAYFSIPLNRDTRATGEPNDKELQVTVDYDVITRDPSLVLNTPAGFSIVNNRITQTLTLPAAFEGGKRYALTLILGLTTVKFKIDGIDDWEVPITVDGVVRDPAEVTRELNINVAVSDFAGDGLGSTTGTTMAALKTVHDPLVDGDGFGLYCGKLSISNMQVTWDEAKGRWNYGSYPYYLPATFAYSDVYAYAPYATSPTVSDGLYTFTVADDLSNTTDLLWANRGLTGTTVDLDFHHALGKLSFGTMTNNYRRNVTLTGITVSEKSITGGERLYKSGQLNLGTGEWTSQSEYTGDKKSATLSDFDLTTDGTQSLVLADGGKGSIDVGSYMLIPGRPVVVTFTFTTADYGTETITKEITLEAGQNKVVSLELIENHGVVMEE